MKSPESHSKEGKGCRGGLTSEGEKGVLIGSRVGEISRGMKWREVRGRGPGLKREFVSR